MAYHQGGEEGKGWLSAKVLRVALWEDEKIEKCFKSRFVMVGNKKCVRWVRVIINTKYHETGCMT